MAITVASSEAIKTASDELRQAAQSGNLEKALAAWKAFKTVIVLAIAARTTDLASVSLIRSSLELACLLHIRNEDVKEFDRCVLLLEPIYIDYPEPLLPASLQKPIIVSLQLLRLLTSGCVGDLHVKLQKLSTSEKSSPELLFVIDLERNLMSGNYEKCVAHINSPPNPHLQFLCHQLKETLRNRVASSLQKSHTAISVHRAKQLLMFENDQELILFIDELNKNAISVNDEDELMSEKGANAVNQEDEPVVQWNFEGNRIQFITTDVKTKQIPVDEVINCVIGVEEPQLIIDDDHCPILSSYAITRYLLLQSKNESFLKSHSNPATMWTIDSYVLWALNHLRRAIDSVDKNVIHQVLITLDETLFGSKSGFLVGDSLTLADIFVWSSIYTSRIYSNAIEFLDSHPETKNYITLISSTPSAQAALHILFDGDLTTSHRRIVPIDSPKEKFYLTTAINYTNGSPHIGHAYEAICSDVICRYHRIYGRDVFFLTGTDEHGQKIAQTAEKMGMSPIEICDLYSKQFKELNLSLNISNDFFIRTTTHEHKAIAQNVWKLSQAKGDIYLDTYTGWYNIREETFITEFEAQASDYKDPMSGVPLQKMEEVSYFFKMSKYQQALIDHINNHPEFIQPDFRRNEILARLKEPLTDLSTSRTTFSWGVPVPGDESHVMYVWFDALTNYLSGVGYTTCNLLSRFWPADVHVIGKDITWFHCVIWPCILMSAGIALPKTVFAHGFVVAGDGRKMSKSLGNVIEPLQLIKQFPNADTFRFYTVKGACFGRDLRFDLDAMNDCHNSDLADTLGNLVHRATGLCQKYCNGYIPDCPLPDGEPPFNFDSAAQSMDLLMRRFCLQEASEIAMQACRDTNKYLTDRAPWAVSDVVEKQKICRALVEAVYILAHLFEPFIPISADEIFKRLGTPRSHLRSLSGWFDNLKPGTSINVGEVLFVKREAKPDKDGAASSPKKEEKKGNKTNGNSVIH